MAITALFSPFTLRGVTVPNRIVVSPMCMYSARGDGMPTEFHAIHLGSRAVGGAGLVFVEATAVSPEGRITLGDLGLWSPEQADAHAGLVRVIHEHGSVAGVQLAHAGRKAGRTLPWNGNTSLPEAEWGKTLAPSDIPYRPGGQTPRAMTRTDMLRIAEDFAASTTLAARAGYDVLEGHFAHGYLMHQFLSPLSNTRDDEFGGSLRNRARFPLEVVRAMRRAWPQDKPLFIRLSVVDWAPGGIDLEESVQVATWLREEGVDLIDCSSGAVVPGESIPERPLYHLEMSHEIRERAQVPTSGVGRILTAEDAEACLRSGGADLTFIGRAMLQDPYWPRRAARALSDENALAVPLPYRRSTQHLS